MSDKPNIIELDLNDEEHSNRVLNIAHQFNLTVEQREEAVEEIAAIVIQRDNPHLTHEEVRSIQRLSK